MLRLTATAGATALLAGIGALATAGSASAATAPAAQTRVTTMAHFGEHECCWRWTSAGWVWCCDRDRDFDHDDDGLVQIGLVNIVL
jgi:uncharacterized protein YgiB involved in biofilm formation